jgi:hypothetical protein
MPSRGRFGAQALLDLMQATEDLTVRLKAAERPSERGKLTQRRAAALRRLRGALARGSDPFRAALRGLAAATQLKRDDLVIVMALFLRRLRRPQPTTPGRELLEVVASRGDLAGRAKALHPEAALIRAGIVITDAFQPEHVFDAGFRLNDDVFKLLYRAYHGMLFDPTASDPPRPAPFTSWSDHLLATRALVELAKRRAARLFPQSAWAESFSDEERAPEELQRLFDLQAELLRAREAATPESVRLPLLAMRRDFGLSADDELMLVALLLQELYSSHATLELGELLRLIARDEADLLGRRGAVAPQGRLREAGLLVVEGEAEGKDLISSAWLPPWLSERLLGAGSTPRAIGADERSKFHDYLQTLQSSEDFYRRL